MYFIEVNYFLVKSRIKYLDFMDLLSGCMLKKFSYNGGKGKVASNLSTGDELLTEDGKIVLLGKLG
jgi:hypothetical protein